MGFAPVAITLSAFATLLGVFGINRLPKDQMIVIPVLIVTLFICVSLVYAHMEKILARFQKGRYEGDSIEDQKRLIEKEMAYCHERKEGFLKRSGQRRHLVQAAKEMGSLLDPTAIQHKLIETAQTLFPGRPIQISYGQNADAIDNYVIQKKQSLLIPDGPNKGNPLIASPITSQSAVAGVIRVGGEAGPLYTRDDLRLLDILASLASLALDNTALFNQIEETALRDGLTGLLTHRAFQDHLEAQLLEASRFKKPLSIILADVDHFKSVNDNYGHQAGDQILQGVAHIIDRNVRDIDIVARYGGEEFIVILLETNREDAVHVAEQIRQDLEGQSFNTGSKTISISSSFGVATFPNDATSAQQLVRQADQRLYKAKEGGRNRVVGA